MMSKLHGTLVWEEPFKMSTPWMHLKSIRRHISEVLTRYAEATIYDIVVTESTTTGVRGNLERGAI